LCGRKEEKRKGGRVEGGRKGCVFETSMNDQVPRGGKGKKKKKKRETGNRVTKAIVNSDYFIYIK